MTLYQPEPVEISTRMRPGEWTEESLTALADSYREELLRMGAAASAIEITTDRDQNGGVSMVATWVKPADADEEAVPGEGAL